MLGCLRRDCRHHPLHCGVSLKLTSNTPTQQRDCDCYLTPPSSLSLSPAYLLRLLRWLFLVSAQRKERDVCQLLICLSRLACFLPSFSSWTLPLPRLHRFHLHHRCYSYHYDCNWNPSLWLSWRLELCRVACVQSQPDLILWGHASRHEYLLCLVSTSNRKGEEKRSLLTLSSIFPSLKLVRCDSVLFHERDGCSRGLSKGNLGFRSCWDLHLCMHGGHNLRFRWAGRCLSSFTLRRVTISKIAFGVALVSLKSWNARERKTEGFFWPPSATSQPVIFISGSINTQVVGRWVKTGALVLLSSHLSFSSDWPFLTLFQIRPSSNLRWNSSWVHQHEKRSNRLVVDLSCHHDLCVRSSRSHSFLQWSTVSDSGSARLLHPLWLFLSLSLEKVESSHRYSSRDSPSGLHPWCTSFYSVTLKKKLTWLWDIINGAIFVIGVFILVGGTYAWVSEELSQKSSDWTLPDLSHLLPCFPNLQVGRQHQRWIRCWKSIVSSFPLRFRLKCLWPFSFHSLYFRSPFTCNYQ